MGTLYIVATPIGNLEDITLRALRVLREADLIVCEDTRRAGILLERYEINKTLISFHQHSRLQKIEYIITQLKVGKDVALITDAGTPGVADPGAILIQNAIRDTIKVETIPGPSALSAILSLAGLPAEKFLFLGFLPKKKGRETLFKNLKNFSFPIIIFESPERVEKTLSEIEQKWGDRYVVIGRELTKKFSEVYRGNISKIKVRAQGEFVIFINHE